jgi:hypothetical protein
MVFFNFCFYAASDLQLLKAAAVYELAKSPTHPPPFYTDLHVITLQSNNQRLIEQFASNNLSLLLKIILEDTQTLQLFTKIIKTESIYESY